MANIQETDEVNCKGCKKHVEIRKLLRHIGQSQDCKMKYGTE